MSTPQTHVERLVQAGVLPAEAEAALSQAQRDTINGLTQDEVDTVLSVHSQVGDIEVPGPMWLMRIF